MASWFSWELGGSSASLLGTGVTLEGRFLVERELDLLVDSLRQGDSEAEAGAEAEAEGRREESLDGAPAFAALAGLEKKLMMDR